MVSLRWAKTAIFFEFHNPFNKHCIDWMLGLCHQPKAQGTAEAEGLFLPHSQLRRHSRGMYNWLACATTEVHLSPAARERVGKWCSQ